MTRESHATTREVLRGLRVGESASFDLPAGAHEACERRVRYQKISGTAYAIFGPGNYRIAKEGAARARVTRLS